MSGGDPVRGYEVLAMAANTVAWPVMLALIMVERHYQLPSSPGHGHGAILLGAWTIAFVCENLDFLSLNNREWFFDLTS